MEMKEIARKWWIPVPKTPINLQRFSLIFTFRHKNLKCHHLTETVRIAVKNEAKICAQNAGKVYVSAPPDPRRAQPGRRRPPPAAAGRCGGGGRGGVAGAPDGGTHHDRI